jgi:hypothetical protein
MNNYFSEPLVDHEEDQLYDQDILDLIDSGSINLSRNQYFNLNNYDN